VRAIATEALLHDDRTASHYYVGTRQEMRDGKLVDVPGVGSDGKPIVLGEEMEYLEWGGATQDPVVVWYVYQKTPADQERLDFNDQTIAKLRAQLASEPDELAHEELTYELDRILNVWQPAGVYEDADSALVAAIALLPGA
jgi:hypothetical protein